MNDQIRPDQLGDDGGPRDADLRRVAAALVAEAPPAAPLPAQIMPVPTEEASARDGNRVSRGRAWPLAAAAVALALVGVLALNGWSRSSESVTTVAPVAEPTAEREMTATAVPADVEATATAAQPDDSERWKFTPGRSEPGLFLSARASGTDEMMPISVYDEPGGEPRLLVDYNPFEDRYTNVPLLNPTPFGQPLVLRVVEGAVGDEWVKVQAPIRPHGQTVWVPTEQFDFGKSSIRIEVDLAGRDAGTLTVFDDGIEILSSPIVSGRVERPTALHATYVEQIIAGDKIGPAYGNWLITTASFSEALSSFGNGLPGQTIHGTNQPEVMGQRISSGGIRVPDDVMQQIVDLPNLVGATVIKFNSDDPERTKEALLAQSWVPATTTPHNAGYDIPEYGFS